MCSAKNFNLLSIRKKDGTSFNINAFNGIFKLGVFLPKQSKAASGPNYSLIIPEQYLVDIGHEGIDLLKDVPGTTKTLLYKKYVPDLKKREPVAIISLIKENNNPDYLYSMNVHFIEQNYVINVPFVANDMVEITSNPPSKDTESTRAFKDFLKKLSADAVAKIKLFTLGDRDSVPVKQNGFKFTDSEVPMPLSEVPSPTAIEEDIPL